MTLPAGRYQLRVTKAGYVTMDYGQRRLFEPGTPISEGDGETVPSIDFARRSAWSRTSTRS
jgi:hypothetical protein